jgi:S-adenosylmethionine-diacylgycerolhomoserine-N-methlytransferase
VTEGRPRTDTHAALMDGVYRYQRHIYDLTRKYYLFGRDRLVRQAGVRPGETVVEIGCGTARNMIRLARTYPGSRLYGLDASRAMLRTAEEATTRARLSDRITLKHGLAEEMTPALFGLERKFDHAIFSYSLSMIPDWRAALRTAAEAAQPTGTIHIVDFGDLKGLLPPFAAALRAWLRLYHVQPRDKLLRVLEMGPRGSSDYVLNILPGRYAFILKCKPAQILNMLSHPVAD